MIYNLGEFLGVITLIGAIAGERRLKLSFPGRMTQFQILMIDKVWAHFWL